MNESDFVNALQNFAEGASIDLIESENHFYELRLQGSKKTDKRFFLLYGVDHNEEIAEVQFKCIVGAIDDPRSLLTVLLMNYNGVMDSEFYFSVLKTEEVLLIALETKQSLLGIDGTENMITILAGLWLHPLFTRKWDFPSGVHNFLW